MNKDALKTEIKDLIAQLYEQFNHTESTELLNGIEQLYKKAVVLNYLNNSVQEAEQENQRHNPNFQITDENTEVQIVTELKEEVIVITEETPPVAETADTQQETQISNLKSQVQETSNSEPTQIPNPEPQIPNLKPLTIGINDKFQLIAELFKNSSEQYNSAIQQLNNFETLSASLFFIEELGKQNNWPENSNASERLITIVKNRFSKL